MMDATSPSRRRFDVPQQQPSDDRIEAVMILGAPTHGVQFASGRFYSFPTGTWTAAISTLCTERISRRQLIRAFVGDVVELEDSGLAPDALSEAPATRRLRQLQRRTVATFAGGGDFRVGDVLVRAGAGYSVSRLNAALNGSTTWARKRGQARKRGHSYIMTY